MIAADTGTWIAFPQGESGEGVRLLDFRLWRTALLAPRSVRDAAGKALAASGY